MHIDEVTNHLSASSMGKQAGLSKHFIHFNKSKSFEKASLSYPTSSSSIIAVSHVIIIVVVCIIVPQQPQQLQHP